VYVCMHRFGGTNTSTRAYTRTQARGATPELRRVADTTSHGLSVGRGKGGGLTRCKAYTKGKMGMLGLTPDRCIGISIYI